MAYARAVAMGNLAFAQHLEVILFGVVFVLNVAKKLFDDVFERDQAAGPAELADDETAGTKSFLAVLNGYLAVGLLVGISGLSVVLLRAVQERRRNLAVLRAVGVRTEVIRRAFLVEGVLIGTQGVATGMVIWLLTSWLSMTRSGAFEEGLTFAVP